MRTEVVGEDATVGETACGFSGEGNTIRKFPRTGFRFPVVACVGVGVTKDKELRWTRSIKMTMIVAVVVVVMVVI